MPHRADRPHVDKRFVRAALLVLCFALTGCNLFSATSTAKGDAGADGPDAGDVGDMAGGDNDADGTCQPETDEELCARNGAECGTSTYEDNCGRRRAVACGVCPAGSQCGLDTPMQCGCTAETAPDFCDRLAKDCGMLTADDNCGTERTEDCGTCTDGSQCGEGSPNVCGCPCNIDGVCYPAGAANPNNACQVCEPDTDATGWTIPVGEACDDGDACTENDVCADDATCSGSTVDCSGLTGECQQPMCDAVDGCVLVPLPDGASCPEVDNLSCTTSTCTNSTCMAALDAGSCIIGNACVAAGELNSANGCQECDPANSTTDWTTRADGASCPGGTCMAGTCDTVLPCDPPSDAECLIDGQCWVPDQVNPQSACDVCDPTQSKTAWTLAPGTCVIGGECYEAGDPNPNEICLICDPTNDESDWTDAPNDTICSGTCTCFNGSCRINGSCTP